MTACINCGKEKSYLNPDFETLKNQPICFDCYKRISIKSKKELKVFYFKVILGALFVFGIVYVSGFGPSLKGWSTLIRGFVENLVYVIVVVIIVMILIIMDHGHELGKDNSGHKSRKDNSGYKSRKANSVNPWGILQIIFWIVAIVLAIGLFLLVLYITGFPFQLIN